METIMEWIGVVVNYSFVVTFILILVCIYWLDTYLWTKRAKIVIRKLWAERKKKSAEEPKQKERKFTSY